MSLSLGLGLGLGLGSHRKVGANLDPYGELPATFTVTSSVGDGTDYIRVKVSEATTVTPAGGSTRIRIGNTGQFATTPLNLTANTNQDIYFKGTGRFIIPRRKQITFLQLSHFGYFSSPIACDITGMKLTYLYLYDVVPCAITGDITGMKLTYLFLVGLGSSAAITGDISGMKLTALVLNVLGSSSITGEISGMEIARLFLSNLGSSLTYGTNPLNVTHQKGLKLLGNTRFATAAEYARLIHDAATGTWGGVYPFVITAGTNANCPDWDTVKADVATLLTKAAWTVIPSAWLTTGGGSWPTTWKNYTGE